MLSRLQLAMTLTALVLLTLAWASSAWAQPVATSSATLRVLVMPVNVLPDDVDSRAGDDTKLVLREALSETNGVELVSAGSALAPQVSDYIGPLLVPKVRLQELSRASGADLVLVTAVGMFTSRRFEVSLALLQVDGLAAWSRQIEGAPDDLNELLRAVLKSVVDVEPLSLSAETSIESAQQPKVSSPTKPVIARKVPQAHTVVSASPLNLKKEKVVLPTTNPLAKGLVWGGLSTLVVGVGVGLTGKFAFENRLQDGAVRTGSEAQSLNDRAHALAVGADVALLSGLGALVTGIVFWLAGVGDYESEPKEAPAISESSSSVGARR